MSGIAFYILQCTILRAPGGNPRVAAALGKDVKGKISPVLYTVGIVLSFTKPWIACAVYVLVAMMWLIPDRRFERVIMEQERE